MIRFILSLILLYSILDSATNNIDSKIKTNEKILEENKDSQLKTDFLIKILAKQISTQNQELSKLEADIKTINEDIDKHESQLDLAKKELSGLQSDSQSLIKEKKENESQIVKVIIDEFSTAIALKLADESSIEELIDSEIYTILSQSSKDEILKLNNSYELVTQNKKENQSRIKKIAAYIEDRKKKKNELNELKKKYSESLVSLESKHKIYQEELKKTIQKQESLKDLLGQLNILKKEEIEKEKRERIAEAKKLATIKKVQSKKSSSTKESQNYDIEDSRNEQYANNINMDVKMIGSSTSGIKISKYTGRKTISPLDDFEVVKKFGTYFDPVYKIELFNESVVLKTKEPEAKVKAIFNGKIVYAKQDAGILENVVIIAHQDGLHTIYSHLDQISPSLKVGRWIKKGYVVGCVNDTLTFQATKNEMHINPDDLFKI